MQLRTLVKDALPRIGKFVNLMGWVQGRRDHGKLIFIDLRDRSGLVQVVFTPADKELLGKADRLRSEWVIRLEGEVKERPPGMQNPALRTGTIEIAATGLEILAEAQTPPFALDTPGYEIGEEHRMQYRYLDLRRTRLQHNLRIRDRAISFIREFLHARDFVEIETPIITKSTPEGARDYIVPSRLYPGMFYALPQSPQQYKQLLMVAGMERYFQIARCFRDEDTRGDRQPEFTQLDLEMSFVEREDIMALNEELLTALVRVIATEKRIAKTPFPRLTYKEAIDTYGTDRPDLRANKDDPNECAFCWITDFPLFEKEEGAERLTYSHNPFTSPRPEYIDMLMNDYPPEQIYSQQYDIVLNGYEIGGGGIRIHQPEVLKKIFSVLGHSEEAIQRQFGHMLAAFGYGTPPHGGIAWGFDRLIMLLANEPNIREVIAFPKTGDARDLMMQSPSTIDQKQLDELRLSIKKAPRDG